MSDLKAALHSYLPAELAAIDGRLFPSIAPENAARPYVIYEFISAEHVRYINAASGFCSRRVQFDIYADRSTDVETVFEQLRQALFGFMGTMGTLEVLSASLENERDDYVEPTDASQVGKHRRTTDYVIWHRESIPTF